MLKKLLFLFLLLVPAAFAQTGPPITVGPTLTPVYSPAIAMSVTFVQTSGVSTAYVIYTVDRAVIANKAAGTTYTFSPAPALNFNTGQPVGFVSIPKGTAVFKAKAVTNGGPSVTGSSGQTAYFSGSNAISGATVTLDMAGIAGADLGAKMNNCQTQLPAGGGTCLGDNLIGSLTLSTAVTTSKAVVYHFCGQAVTQTALIDLAASNSSVIGCPNLSTIFTKGANIDQFKVEGQSNRIAYIDMEGVKASFTGNGITFGVAGFSDYIDHNIIDGESGSNIDNSAAAIFNIFDHNLNENWGTHAFVDAGANELMQEEIISGDGTATGVALPLTASSIIITGSSITDSNAHDLITESAFGALQLNNNLLEQLGGYASINALGGIFTGNRIFAGGVGNPAVLLVNGPALFSGNNVTGEAGNSALELNGAGESTVTGNIIGLAGTNGMSGILLTGNMLGAMVDSNIIIVGDGAVASPHNYGVQLLSVAGHMLENTVNNNTVEGTMTVDGFYFNNAGNMNTNAFGNTFSNNKTIHTASTILRADTQNNQNFYSQNVADAAQVFAAGGGGSTNDVIVQTIVAVNFSNLPTTGDGSYILTTDAKQGVASASGAGGIVTRTKGKWITAPTGTSPAVAASGCGAAGASITNNSGVAAFTVNVGTTNSGTCTIIMPAATTDWICSATDITTTSTLVSMTKSVPGGTPSTQITLQNYTDVSATHAWVDSDNIQVRCTAE